MSPKQARWPDFLAEFDMELRYKPGKENHVADALSRKAELAAVCLLKREIIDCVKVGMVEDPLAYALVKLIHEGKIQKFRLRDGLLYTKGNSMVVPKSG